MKIEIWKMIMGFEGRYMISNFGRVMSLGRILHAKDGSIRHYKDKFLKTKPNKFRGYTSVRLCHNNYKNYDHVDVHRLVALHFIPNPDNLPVVNHRDCNRANNHIDNLEWVSVSQNLTHKNAHLRAGESRRKKVYQFTMEGDYIRAWSWANEAVIEGFYPHCITKACLGIIPQYRGFKWTYDSSTIY